MSEQTSETEAIDLDHAMERFEAALARLQRAVDAHLETAPRSSEADSMEDRDDPVANALKAARAELQRLRSENDALRAIGASADEATMARFEAVLSQSSAEGVDAGKAAAPAAKSAAKSKSA